MCSDYLFIETVVAIKVMRELLKYGLGKFKT